MELSAKRMVRPILRLNLVFVTVILLGSCSEDGDGTYEPARCVDTAIVVEDLDEVTCIGISTREMLASYRGSWSCSLEWHDRSDRVQISPDAGVAEAQINVSYDDGEIREIVSDRVGGTKNTSLACIDTLEMDVNVELVSSDGILMENWQVTAEASEAWSIGFDYYPTAFTGTYKFNWREEDAWANEVTRVHSAFMPGYDMARGDITETANNEPTATNDDGTPVMTDYGVFATTAEWNCSR